MIVKLLTEYHLDFLNLTRGCRGLSESTVVKMSKCWKYHATPQINKSKHAYLTSYWSIDLCLVAFFLCWMRLVWQTLCFCDFANWLPFGLKIVLLRSILIFQYEIFRMKLPIKCSDKMLTKWCKQNMYYIYGFQKIDKFYCMCFFFCRVYILQLAFVYTWRDDSCQSVHMFRFVLPLR